MKIGKAAMLLVKKRLMKNIFFLVFLNAGVLITSAQCTEPTGLTITGISSTSISFSWDAVSGVSGYEYAVTDTSLDPLSGTFTIATNASPSFDYSTENFPRYIHVRSKCSTDYSNWILLCKTNPDGLGGSGRFCDGVQLNIGIPTTTLTQQYTWYQSSIKVSGPKDGNGSSQSYNPTMSSSQTGNYTVITTKDGCESTEFGDVTIESKAPVTDLATTYISSDSVRFQWSGNSDSYVYYIFGGSINTSGETSDTSVSVGELTPATSYEIDVISDSCDGNGISKSLFFTTDYIVCPSGTVFFSVQDRGTGFTYQWQADNGSGFTDLTDNINYSGSTTTSLIISNAPTLLSGFKYRCISSYSGNVYSTSMPVTLRFVATWTGNSGNTWQNAANWDCGTLPDENTDIIIPSGASNMPVIDSNVSCRKVQVKPGATLTVASGFTLNITGK
jgi:hypothetical protein